MHGTDGPIVSIRAFLATAGAISLVATACGGDDASPLTSVPPVVSVVGSTSPTSPSSVPTTPPSTATTPPTTIDTQPEDTVPGERPQFPAFEAGLLPDDAFGDPWELQWRESDRLGYEAGPNQTTCAPYWVIEQLRPIGGAHAMWWTDGGNVNHHVGMLPATIRSIEPLARLAEECPTVKWLEGGSFDVTAFAVDGGYAFRFDDPAADQVTWFAATQLGDLVSVLDVPLWTGIGGTMPNFTEDDVRRTVAQMRVRLATLAKPTPPPSPSTTTVAPPVLRPASTTTVAETAPSTTEAPPSGLAALLLTAEHLPADFEPPSVSEFSHGTRDEDVEAACPAFESVHEIDLMFEWTLRSGNGLMEFEQIIGRAPSADEASAVVRRFGDVGACDLSALLGGKVTTSGGELAIAGADAASILRIEAEDMLAGELVLIAVGDVVMALTTEARADVGIEDFDLDPLVELAVDRVGVTGG